MFEFTTWHASFPRLFHKPPRYTFIGKQLLLSNDRNRVRGVVLVLSQDGASTNLFENFRENTLKRDLSNDSTANPPLFSLVNTFNTVIFFIKPRSGSGLGYRISKRLHPDLNPEHCRRTILQRSYLARGIQIYFPTCGRARGCPKGPRWPVTSSYWGWSWGSAGSPGRSLARSGPPPPWIRTHLSVVQWILI
jgi:hypothetical protein